MKPERQEQLTDTTKIKTTLISNVPLHEAGGPPPSDLNPAAGSQHADMHAGSASA